MNLYQYQVLDPRRLSTKPFGLAALAGLFWAVIAVAAASLAPQAYVPKLFHNYHVEHFAAFYLLGLFTVAALPRAPLIRVGLWLSGLAVLFALLRVFGVINRTFYAEDLVSDLAGILAAIVPVFVGRSHPASDLRETSPWER